MYMHLRDDPFSTGLRETGRSLAPDPQRLDTILQAVLREAGVEKAVSYEEALLRLEGGASKKIIPFPYKLAVYAAGLAAVAAIVTVGPDLPHLVTTRQGNDLVTLPDQQVPLAAGPGFGSYEMLTEENGAYSIRIFDGYGVEAAWVIMDCRQDGSPVLDGCLLINDQVRFVVNDAFDDVCWEAAFAMDQDGNQMEPKDMLLGENVLVFDAPQTSLDLYLLDSEGNWWTCLLTLCR